MLVKFTNYKYIDSIINGQIKSSFSKNFNDPFDSRLILDDEIIQEIAENLDFSKSGITSVPVLKDKISSVKFHIEMINSSQITSFIKYQNEQDPFTHESSMLMWAHYAENGKNLAVCFDNCVLDDGNSYYKDACFDVAYIDKPVASKETVKKYMIASIEGNLQRKRQLLVEFYQQKANVWKYESEFRVLNMNILSASVPKLQVVNDSEKSIKILKEFCDEFNNSSLSFLELGKPKKIIMGYDFNLNDEKSLKGLCESNGVALSKVCIPTNFSDYKFEEKILYKGFKNLN